MGALGAVVVGYTVGGLPIWGHLPLALAAGVLGGPCGAPFLGSSKPDSAPTRSSTIMMNYIALKLVDYLVKQVLRDPTASMDRPVHSAYRRLAAPLWPGHAPARGSPHRPRGGRPGRLAARQDDAWIRDTDRGYQSFCRPVRRDARCPHVGVHHGAVRHAGRVQLEPWKSSACTIHFPPLFRRATALTRSPSLYWPNHVPSVFFPLPSCGGDCAMALD